MPIYANLSAGDPVPWFFGRTVVNPRYAFDSVAGRYIVLCFFSTALDPHSRLALDAVRSRPKFFDDTTACFFGVSLDPKDETETRVTDHYPGYRYFWDFDCAISRLYGAVALASGDSSPKAEPVRRLWVVIDPTLRVKKVFPFAHDQSDVSTVIAYLDSLPPPSRFAGFELQAPILVLPDVFEPEFGQKLISLYESHGGHESGFMREVAGRTVAVHDHGHKRRKDRLIHNNEVIKEAQARFTRRVVPMIQRAHQFKVTRMERYIVCCYAAEDEAHFGAHRDNTTKATAHRRFAVSVNLNDDFDGGEVYFPEYGSRSYKAPAGGAVVFSCSMLHAVSKVTRGRRYAFLPFLYDDESARLREANIKFLEDGNAEYKSGLA